MKIRVLWIGFFTGLLLSGGTPMLLAQRSPDADSYSQGQEASVTQAQETMASLFGRGATMPGAPQMNGALALPSFDQRGLQIDETVTQQQEA